MDDEVLRRAGAWVEGDPDPAMRAELEQLIQAGDGDALAARVDGTLEFGTAGIRGVVGAGPLRMNRAVVIRTTRGLADHLVDEHGGGIVALGHDARPDSERFAADAAGVLGAAGFEVHAFDGIVPTPLVAFAAKELQAVAAVVITASHNPPEWNGYKVYDHRAVQIVPPTDTSVARAIDGVGPARQVPRHPGDRPADIDGVHVLGDEVFDRYLARVLAARSSTDRAPLRIAHTPLHGVGGEPVRRSLEAAGYEVHQVASQREPDGHFPTVPFPNPEEPGALDAVLALATEVDADLVLTNDPDVDRLAVAVPDRDGSWLPLDGNQVGVLLADHLLRHDSAPADRLVVTSIVSTPMAMAVAAAHGARHEVTLTGFKWICNAALDLAEADGARLVLGFEEALGYCVGELVRDKDGINAAVAFADLAAACSARGTTVLGYLDELYGAHGRWISAPLNIVRGGPDGPAEITAAMERIGIDRHPESLAGRQVESVRDLRSGAEQRPRWLPEDAVVELSFDGGRALVRPSGTEPKLKIYVDVRVPSDRPVEEAHADAARIGHDLATFLGVGEE